MSLPYRTIAAYYPSKAVMINSHILDAIRTKTIPNVDFLETSAGTSTPQRTVGTHRPSLRPPRSDRNAPKPALRHRIKLMDRLVVYVHVASTPCERPARTDKPNALVRTSRVPHTHVLDTVFFFNLLPMVTVSHIVVPFRFVRSE